jgi:hypothetical protein
MGAEFSYILANLEAYEEEEEETTHSGDIQPSEPCATQRLAYLTFPRMFWWRS